MRSSASILCFTSVIALGLVACATPQGDAANGELSTLIEQADGDLNAADGGQNLHENIASEPDTTTTTGIPEELLNAADGDLDAADGRVNSADFNFWRASYGADLNRDGAIDSADFAIWQANYGTTQQSGGENKSKPQQ